VLCLARVVCCVFWEVKLNLKPTPWRRAVCHRSWGGGLCPTGTLLVLFQGSLDAFILFKGSCPVH
jgi:hypothetical protein